MRRKGERPLPTRLLQITPASPVVIAIAEGTNWMDAWTSEACTPWGRLARNTGIPVNRFTAIKDGDRISRAEIDALARAWSVTSADLISTLPDPTLVVE